MKTAISLNYTEAASGKKGQRSITDINPNATSAQIKTFAQALNGLTTNNYVETNRIQTLNVDTEEAPSGGGSNTPETLYLTALNSNDEVIGTVAVTKYTYEQAHAVLTGEDLQNLEDDYAAYQETVYDHEGFCWLAGTVPENAILLYGFATQINNPEVDVHGNPMEVVGTTSPYYAKLSQLGAFWIQATE